MKKLMVAMLMCVSLSTVAAQPAPKSDVCLIMLTPTVVADANKINVIKYFRGDAYVYFQHDSVRVEVGSEEAYNRWMLQLVELMRSHCGAR